MTASERRLLAALGRVEAELKKRRNPARKKTAKKRTTTRKKAPARRKAKPTDRRRRNEYRCSLRRAAKPAGTRKFFALNDAAALNYCNGLMLKRLPRGTKVVSLKPTGKTRIGPAAVKKKVTRARGKGSAR